MEIAFIRMRNVPVNKILTELIKAHKSGLSLKLIEIEGCHLSGGDVKNVVDGLIYANAKNIELTFKEASLLDLQKRDIIKYLMNK
jgi:uncharacterized protein YqfA (UPF0365 family)